MREVASSRVCLAKRRLLEELGANDLVKRATESAKPEREPEVARGEPPPIEVAYGKISPATVLIRTSEGMGSGVIVDERGYVLTNQHVVDEFLQPDLTIRVSLELAKVGPTGRVVPEGKVLKGVVVKADAIRDLALVKIVDPPKDLPVAPLAPVDPRVGERVLSIGNAGIGLLWAAKVCNVSRIGDLTRETSMLEAGDCELSDPGDDAEEIKRKKDQCEARRKDTKKQVEESPQGLSIQTTCGLNGGDSGGPLVNVWGEVVGLNESVRHGMSTLAFHVHVAEIRDFLSDRPTEAAAIVPDPYCEGGFDFHVQDGDGDGTIDTANASMSPHFEAGSIKPQGTYLFRLADTKPPAPTIERPFSADVAVMLKAGDAYAFYDRDGDGDFDYLVRDRKADGKPDLAYALGRGKVTKDDKPLPGSTLDPSLLARPADGDRLGSLVATNGLSKLASARLLAGSSSPVLPDLAKVFGKRGHVYDVDDDKIPDAVFGDNDPGEQAMLIDIHSPLLRALKSGDDAAPILEPFLLKPQFVQLDRASGSWTLYDRDANGSLDLALFARKPPSEDDDLFESPEYATHAFSMESGRLGAPVRELVGRRLLRGDLVTDAALKRKVSRGPMRSEPGRGAFPNPFTFAGFEAWSFAELESDRQVLERSDKRSHVVLVDVDRDTKKLATLTADEVANPDKFDAEVAFLRLHDAAWAYYDTNGDGAFDVILYTNDVHTGKVDNAIRLTPDGKDAGSAGADGGLFRPDLVKAGAPLKAKLERLASEVMTPSAPASSK